MVSNSQSSASVDQSVKMPDYFDCKNCAVWNWHGDRCQEFQAAGRCRVAILGQALQAGATQIVLYLPSGVVPNG